MTKDTFFALVLGIALSAPSFADTAPLKPVLNCKGKKDTLQIAVASDAVTIFAGDTAVIGERKDERTKTLKTKTDLTNYKLYENATFYVDGLGYQETYEGNGVNDGEVLIAVRKGANAAQPFVKGDIKLFYTDEEGNLQEDDYNCDLAPKS